VSSLRRTAGNKRDRKPFVPFSNDEIYRSRFPSRRGGLVPHKQWISPPPRPLGAREVSSWPSSPSTLQRMDHYKNFKFSVQVSETPRGAYAAANRQYQRSADRRSLLLCVWFDSKLNKQRLNDVSDRTLTDRRGTLGDSCIR